MNSKWGGLWVALCIPLQILAAEPQWLTDARAREGKLEALREIHSSDGTFTAKLPVAVIGPIEKQRGSYSIEFSVGSDANASCLIFPDDRDPAALLRGLAQQTFSDVIEKAQGKVEAREVEVINAGEFGTTPFVALSWLYRVNDGKDRRVGAMKQYAADKQGHGIYCAHVDLGYAQTFESVVRALVESLEFHDPKAVVPKPFHYELGVANLRGLRVGYALTTLERDGDGDIKAVQRSALLIPVTQDTLTSSDSFRVEWTHADGTLINAAIIESVNDVLDVNLKLSSLKGQWHVEGEFKSKRIDEIIESPRAPDSWLSQALQHRALLSADSPREAVSVAWESADPTHFTESRITVVERASNTKEAHFRDSVAGVVADITADAVTGQFVKAVIPTGNQTLTIERIDAQGSY